MLIHAPSGEIIAQGVSFEDYLERFMGQHCEWIGGTVIKMSPIMLRHNDITDYLLVLLSIYFRLRPIGRVLHAPFTMKIESAEVAREPDLQVILNTNPGTIKATYMDGAADICIEVVSPESVLRDRGEKFIEYEKGGVGEYWIVDPLRKQSLFYELDANGVYIPRAEDTQGNYVTPRLPGLILHVPTLWQEKLPDPLAIGDSLRQMLPPE
jgi:Uma2 family endonuclease